LWILKNQNDELVIQKYPFTRDMKFDTILETIGDCENKDQDIELTFVYDLEGKTPLFPVGCFKE